MSRSPGSYSWLPGFLRRFLNLDDDMPSYGPSSYRADSYSPPPSRPAAPPTYAAPTYTAPEPPRYASSYTPAEPTAPRFSATYTPPAGPPPPAARSVGADGTGNGTVAPGANLPEGYAQPIGYLLRSYARGALPPQGLEQFTRETRATTTDLWNFYSYWTRFQTDEVFRIGRELFDTIFEDRPASADGATPSTNGGSIRRIKVTTANGNGEEKAVERVPVELAPEPTPAPPPTPPAPTVVFSAPVTADDAEVPPGGAPAYEPPAPPAPPDVSTGTTTDLGDDAKK